MKDAGHLGSTVFFRSALGQAIAFLEARDRLMRLGAGANFTRHRHEVFPSGRPVGPHEPLLAVLVLDEPAGRGAEQTEPLVFVDDLGAGLLEVLVGAEALDHDALHLGVALGVDLLQSQRLGSHDDLLRDVVALDHEALEAVAVRDGGALLVVADAILHVHLGRPIADDRDVLEDVVPAGVAAEGLHDRETLDGRRVHVHAQHFLHVLGVPDPVALAGAVGVRVGADEVLRLLELADEFGDDLVIVHALPDHGVDLVILDTLVHERMDELLSLVGGSNEEDEHRLGLLGVDVEGANRPLGFETIRGAGSKTDGQSLVTILVHLRFLFLGQFVDLVGH